MSPVESLFTTYKNAVAEKNVDLLADLFSEQFLLFDLWDQWSMTGREAWRSAVKEWFDSLGSETLTADFEALQETVTDKLVSVCAFVTYTAFSSDGMKLRSKKERTTWVVSLEQEGWRIIHCHNSSPINPETGQPR